MQKQFIKGFVTKSSEGGTYKVLASTSAIDRQGDSIDQNGWDLANYKNNPVMLWAHDYSGLPAAKGISIYITDKGLEVEFEFAPAEGNPKAQQIKTLYDEGYLNAVSVGFIIKERKGNIITKAELLEISFVPVPANQEALRLAFQAKSIDVSALPEMKGAVAYEVNAEEIWEQKYEKYNEVCEILSAFWKVYFSEETMVDNFDTLLKETIDLLSALIGQVDPEMEETDMAKAFKNAIKEGSMEKFASFVSEKSGRTLSKSTLDKINNAVESMKTASSVLEDLVSSSEVQDGEEGANASAEKSEQEVDEKTEDVESNVLHLTGEDLAIVRQTLVAKDKTNELALSIVNAHMKKMGLK